MLDKIKAFFRKINNKCTAFMFTRYPEYISVQFLADPVQPRILHKPKLNMGFNPKKRGPTLLHQFQAKGNNWHYNPYFVSFLRVVVNMDAFPVSFLNGQKGVTVEYDELLADLNKLGHDDYTEAFKQNETSFVNNGIVAFTNRDNKRYVYINEWDLFIAAVDSYAVFDL